MNITPHTANLPLATVVNPPTEVLRRDNNQRAITPQVAATHPSTADKGVASDKERSRTPAQTNEHIDFTNLRKQAEHAASSISEQNEQQTDQQSAEQNSQRNAEHNSEEQEDSHNHNAATGNNSSESSATENSKEVIANEQIINQLQQRDKEVRAHELAHASMGGTSTGSPSYAFEVGPDGKKYALSGEVSVDLSGVAGDPQTTITKMKKVQSAALAPANPSSQDIKVAASAAQKILNAQSELLALNNDQERESSSTNNNSGISTNSSFNSKVSTDTQNDTSNEFDVFINQTLAAQEVVSPNPANVQVSTSDINNVQSNDVIQRANRIESFYFNVSQGYEKPDNYQFELTA